MHLIDTLVLITKDCQIYIARPISALKGGVLRARILVGNLSGQQNQGFCVQEIKDFLGLKISPEMDGRKKAEAFCAQKIIDFLVF